jgi:Flp pilus assembly protein TadB
MLLCIYDLSCFLDIKTTTTTTTTTITHIIYSNHNNHTSPTHWSDGGQGKQQRQQEVQLKSEERGQDRAAHLSGTSRTLHCMLYCTLLALLALLVLLALLTLIARSIALCLLFLLCSHAFSLLPSLFPV